MYVLTELHKQNFRPKQHTACKVLHSCTADISHWVRSIIIRTNHKDRLHLAQASLSK